MLMIQSNEGDVKIAVIGSTVEICAETSTVIHAIACQMIRPLEDTEYKLAVLKTLRYAIDYAIDEVKKEVLT